MKKGWSKVPLGEVLIRRKRQIVVDDLEHYKRVTIRLNNNGIALRDLELGERIGTKIQFRVKEGDFIISKIDARNGAFGVVPSSCDHAIITGNFWTFEVNQAISSARYLYWISKSPLFLEFSITASEGTTNRKYLQEKAFYQLQVSLPPLSEQQRIVAHLDAIESRLTRAQNLRVEAAKEAEAFTTSLHLAAAEGRMVRLGQLMQLKEKQESITAEGSYPQIGVRSFGMGLFKKPPVLGANTTYRAFNVLSSGQFVMSQVKGWEGAVGVADEDYEGWFASPEYRTFSCIEDECDWKYLAHIASTAWFRRQLLAATKGIGARRERVRPEMLLGLEMPFPVVTRQTEAVSLLEKQVAGKRLSSLSAVREASLLPSLLDRIFKA